MGAEYTRNTKCRYCDSEKLSSILDLGQHPPSDSFIYKEEIPQEKRFPLELFFCEECYLLQILDVVSPELLFGGEFLYRSSTSKALKNHYTTLTDTLKSRFKVQAGDIVVDIGCNDGILLNTYNLEGLKRIGVEPSELAAEARESGNIVYREFFNQDMAQKILNEHGPAKVITATNVFPHVDDISFLLQGVRDLIQDTGIFAIEASYALDFVDQTLFDTIYHEHLCYLSLTPLHRFLKRFDLQVFDLERVPIGASGPAIRFLIQSTNGKQETMPSVENFLNEEKAWGVGDVSTYKRFGERAQNAKTEILKFLSELKSQGHEIGGYGAPAKGNTLLNYLECDSNIISYISDNNNLKQGKVTPGSHIPVISDEEFLKNQPPYALLLAWNYLDFFLKNSDYIKQGGRFIVPLPEPKIQP